MPQRHVEIIVVHLHSARTFFINKSMPNKESNMKNSVPLIDSCLSIDTDKTECPHPIYRTSLSLSTCPDVFVSLDRDMMNGSPTIAEPSITQAHHTGYLNYARHALQFCSPHKKSTNAARSKSEGDVQSTSSTKMYDDAMKCLCFTCENCLKVQGFTSKYDGVYFPEELEFVNLKKYEIYENVRRSNSARLIE